MRFKQLSWLIFWLVLVAGLAILFGLRSYRVFTQEELVAVVRCDLAPHESNAAFLLWVTPVSGGIPGTPERFPMVGDQWAIGGEVLKWHPWLNLLGVKTCYKLSRISSRYLKVESERTRPRMVYDLQGGTTPVWLFLYQCQQIPPFVEAVYGNSTYAMAQPGTRWGVYVTLSGFLIRPLRPRPVS